MPNPNFYGDLGDPVSIAIRPLSKGMNTVSPSMTLEDGAFFDLQGVEVLDRGLVRRECWNPMFPTAIPYLFSDEFAQEYEMFFNGAGTRKAVVLTNRTLYEVRVGEGIFPVYFGRTYTQSETAAVPTISGVSFVEDGVKIGDYVRFTVGTVTYLLEVTTVAATTLVAAGGPASIPSGTTLNIVRTFNREDGFVDYTIARGEMLIVDGTLKGVTSYSTTYLTQHVPYYLDEDDDEIPTFLGAKTITWFGGRVFYGGVIESDGTHRQRTRWSTALDKRNCEVSDYMDHEDCQGDYLKLSAMGTLLFVYMTDAIYYGRPANLANLPYTFTKMETGGIAAVGMKAIVPHADGQFFVARDDVYYISASTGLTPLASSINRTSVRNNRNLRRTYLKGDPIRNRLVMALAPSGGNHFDELYYFNLRTKAWSRDLLQYTRGLSGLSIACNFDPTTWAESTGTWAAATGSWLSRRSETSEKLCVAVDVRGFIYTLKVGRSGDVFMTGASTSETISPRVYIETGDFDFGGPDDDKTWYRIGMKTTDLAPRAGTIEFIVKGSIDRGRTWKRLGTLHMEAGDDEDIVTFRLTGSLGRFRFESNSPVGEYEINELVMRVSGRGVEQQRTSGYR